MAWSLVVSLALQLAPPASVVVQPPPPAFSLDRVAPHFPSGKAQSGVAMLRLDRPADAAALFGEAQKTEGKAVAIPLKFLLATAQLRAGRAAEAAKLFDELRGQYALLADYVLLGSARAHLALGHYEEARARIAALPATSPLAADAQLVEADLRIKQGQLPEAAGVLSIYLTKYPDSWRQHEIRAKLARTLDSAGKKEAAEVEWRRLYVEAPHESYGQEAAQHLADRTLPADDKQRRAMALFEGMRNKESEEEWKQVLLLPTPVSEPDQCVARFHLAQSVFKQRDRGRAAPLFDEARVICEKAKNEDLLVKSIYQAGRSYGSRGPKEPALMQKGIERFGEIVEHHKDHSYADDALVRRAELVETLGQKDESKKLLGEVAARFPGGDQRGEALWRLAFAALREKDYATADKWLTQALTEMPRQDGWWEAGRTLYWLGRSAELRGEKVKAIDYYQRTAREYPLAYYSLFALNRLRGLDAPTYEKLVTPWVDDKPPTVWTWQPQPLFADPAWARAVELLRLGLGTEAKRELYQLGLAPPKRGTAVAATEEDKLWLATALLDAAGQWAASHAIPRYFVTSYSKSWPVGPELRRWLLSYPRGFSDLVEPATKDNAFPAELEFAIIREESAFDPLMESFANAVGLTQLTADPAKRFALGLPHDRAALRIPSINVPIGARELGHLVKMYAGNFPLAIAGYNAGEGAVNRWLREPERNDGNLDLFLEAIPYDETRGYTKRVLSSYFAYAWLAGKTLDERVPKLIAQTPKR